MKFVISGILVWFAIGLTQVGYWLITDNQEHTEKMLIGTWKVQFDFKELEPEKYGLAFNKAAYAGTITYRKDGTYEDAFIFDCDFADPKQIDFWFQAQIFGQWSVDSSGEITEEPIRFEILDASSESAADLAQMTLEKEPQGNAYCIAGQGDGFLVLRDTSDGTEVRLEEMNTGDLR